MADKVIGFGKGTFTDRNGNSVKWAKLYCVVSAWRKDLNQWFRDLRKRGLDISYAFVPERHKDGAWHIHGLLRCPQL